jgi:hypothetical protein
MFVDLQVRRHSPKPVQLSGASGTNTALITARNLPPVNTVITDPLSICPSI